MLMRPPCRPRIYRGRLSASISLCTRKGRKRERKKEMALSCSIRSLLIVWPTTEKVIPRRPRTAFEWPAINRLARIKVSSRAAMRAQTADSVIDEK
jgi:hypothetical protein